MLGNHLESPGQVLRSRAAKPRGTSRCFLRLPVQPRGRRLTSSLPGLRTAKWIQTPEQKAKQSAPAIQSPAQFRDVGRFVLSPATLPFLSSAPHDVNHGENYDPNGIDKMPIQRKHIDTAGLIFVDPSSQTKDKDDSEHDQSCSDVKRVQANKRIISRSEEIGRDRQPVFVNEPVPLLFCVKETATTE